MRLPLVVAHVFILHGGIHVLLGVGFVSGFVPISSTIKLETTTKLQSQQNQPQQQQQQELDNREDDVRLDRQFEEIASKLRVGIHTPGFVSKDPQYGIENIRVTVPVEPSLGLELVEVAHSTTEADSGLVLVSGASGNAANTNPKLQAGDTIVRVACPDAQFQEILTGKDYETTMDAIVQAKTHAQLVVQDNNNSNAAAITIEFNRLVKRAVVQVLVEGVRNDNKPILVEGFAGDNLRLLLRRHKLEMINSSSSHCGGDGICGTCRVRVLEGEELLNKVVQSKRKKNDHQSNNNYAASARLACQTVVGANNQGGTIRISLS